jgi:hypothetical protein
MAQELTLLAEYSEVSMLERIHTLIDAVESEPHCFPPTLVYNEGWMLRLVLDWFQSHCLPDHVLDFRPEATWYSESLLPTPFKARYRGDPRAEARTHADGIFGHISIGLVAKADAELLSDATQFVVTEAKIHSSLSKGIRNAPTYDQAARSVACIAQVLTQANLRPSQLQSLAFVVIAPERRIIGGAITVKLDKKSIEAKVRLRVETFASELDVWWEEWFVPTLEAIQVEVISWESLIDDITTVDEPASRELMAFYERCLKYN